MTHAEIQHPRSILTRITNFIDPERFTDTGLVIALHLWAVPFYLISLGSLEFFRHTEADRSLIAWEMVNRGEYLVPHLLGSVILTKPPLFYWLIAASIRVFGRTDEWVMRLPSALAAIAFVMTQYAMLRAAGARKTAALIGAYFLGTGVLFTTLAGVAEIDMVYGLLSTWAFYGMYFAIIKNSLRFIFLAYGFLGLAFLVKGPPSVAFFAVTALLFFCYRVWSIRRENTETEILPICRRFVGHNLVGLLFFVAIVAAWLSTLTAHVGWESLKYQFQIEVFNRAFAPSTHRHGAFFYLGNSVASLLPWSIFLVSWLVGGCYDRCVATHKKTAEFFTDLRSYQHFVVFNALVVVVTVILLSLAEGKSSRYFFPAYASAINLCVVAALNLHETRMEKLMWMFGRMFSAIGVVALLAVPFVINLKGVPQYRIYLVSFLFITLFLMLEFVCRKKNSPMCLLVLILLMCVVRCGEKAVFVPHRNADKSVLPIVEALVTRMPPQKPLYTIEMFGRWVVYYLKLQGREVFRMTQELARSPGVTSARVYLLLDYEEELWRVKQLRRHDPAVAVLLDVKAGNDRLLLVEVDGTALAFLDPLHDIFPTVPSPPLVEYAPPSVDAAADV